MSCSPQERRVWFPHTGAGGRPPNVVLYLYDANGNTLSDPSGKSYSWDFENRLVQAVVPGTGTVAFKYDPFGRRIQKSSPLGTTNYLYDGMNSVANIIEEMDNNGNILARYTQGLAVDQTLAELRSGVVSYYQQDALSSTTSLSNSTGALGNTYAYDSFGKLTASSGAQTNPFQFTGREFDLETGIYYYRARYYDPQVGRFILEDPITFKGGIDFYRYVLNNPVNKRDPRGLSPSLGCRVTCIHLMTLAPMYFCWDHGLADTSCECPGARGLFYIPDPHLCNEKQICSVTYFFCTPGCFWFQSHVPDNSA